MNTANAEHVTNFMNNWRLNSVGTDSVINKKFSACILNIKISNPPVRKPSVSEYNAVLQGKTHDQRKPCAGLLVLHFCLTQRPVKQAALSPGHCLAQRQIILTLFMSPLLS